MSVIPARQLGEPQAPPQMKMKSLFWNKMAVNKVPTTIWGQLDGPLTVPEPQLRILERLFQHVPPAVVKKKPDTPGSSLPLPFHESSPCCQ